MKVKNLLFSGLVFSITIQISLAQESRKLDANDEHWSAYNREVTYEKGVIYLDAKSNDGLLWLNNTDFTNGAIELDIKGKNERGRSFVGIAFHGQDNQTFDGVYFRPFNFSSSERKNYSVQYIYMPEYDRKKLRHQFPGKYESSIASPPAADEWFRAKIVVKDSSIKVYVNNSTSPSLEVNKISELQSGKIGLWVGNGSDGWFKNVKVNPNRFE
ncbi:MAG: DUF1080 domain-containing protein [Cyclobacteriaceae bacterium]